MTELPRVITTENILNILSSPQGDGITAMICSANWGPVDEVKSLASLSDFKKNYGTHVSGVTGYRAAKAFFNNGGILKVIRVAHTGYAKSSHTFKDGSSVDAIKIEGKYNGTYGDNINITIVENGSNRDIYISDGVSNEAYYNLASNATIISAINTGNLCSASLATGSPALVAAVTATYLTGGNDGTTSLADSDYTTAFDNYLTSENYRYLTIPGKTDNTFQLTMVGKLETRALNEEKYSRYLTGITSGESITTIKARTLGGKRATLCAPSLVDTTDSTKTTLDGSYLACALAGKLCALNIGKAGTNKPLIAEVDTDYNKPEQSELLDDGVTVIAKTNDELRCIKDMTRFNDLTSPYKLGVITDEVDYSRSKYEEYLRNQLGEPNTAENRISIANNLDIISSTLISGGIIEDANDATVVIGASADTITATVTILPVYSIDYINLTINVR